MTEEDNQADGGGISGFRWTTARIWVDEEKLKAWIDGARPRASLIYFTGLFAGHGSQPVNERLQAEARRGMVYLVQRRRQDGLIDYLVLRSSRPAGGTAAPARPSLAQQAANWARSGLRREAMIKDMGR